MNNRKRWSMCLLLCVVLVAALPTVALAASRARLTCGLGFDSARDSTEARWRGTWSIPTAGGAATLMVGVYSERPYKAPAVQGHPVDKGYDDEQLTLSPSTHVMVDIFDWLDRSHKLFSFEGTLAQLTVLDGVQVALDQPFGVVVKIPLNVPAGMTWWMGRMEVVMGNNRCHADIWLLQGFAPTHTS